MSSSEKDYIADRQERYREAHNTMNRDTLDPWVSKNLDYSDYAVGVDHITKLQLKELATGFFASTKDYAFTTVSVNGSKEFTAWEWTAEGEVLKGIPGFPFKVGEELKMMGATLFWWDGEVIIDGRVSDVCSLG